MHCDWPNTTSTRWKCNAPFHNCKLQLFKIKVKTVNNVLSFTISSSPRGEQSRMRDSRHVSITLQIAQIKIENWKYAYWKRVNFAKTPIYRKKVFTLAWGGFSGNLKKEYFAKLQWKRFFSTFTGHMAYVKSQIIILQCTITSKNTSYVVALEYKGLSLPLMLRQFTLHKSAVQCGSDLATEAYCGH